MRRLQALGAALAGVALVVGISVVVARQGSVPDPALRLVPAGAMAYATVDLSPGLAQGRALLDLLERLPDVADDPAAARDAVLDDVLSSTGLTAADIEAWRGARLSGFLSAEYDAALVVATRDEAAALAAAERASTAAADGAVEEREVGGLRYSVRPEGATFAWAVIDGHLVAGAEPAVRDVLDRGPVLGDDAGFVATAAALPGDALVNAYYNGPAFPGPVPFGLLSGAFWATSLPSVGQGVVEEAPMPQRVPEAPQVLPEPTGGGPLPPGTPEGGPPPGTPENPEPLLVLPASPDDLETGEVQIYQELPAEIVTLQPDEFPGAPLPGSVPGLGDAGPVALALSAGADALRLDMASQPSPDMPGLDVEGSEALGDLPAEALAGVAVPGLGELLLGVLDGAERSLGAPLTPDDLGFDVKAVLSGLGDARGFVAGGVDVTDAGGAQPALEALRALVGSDEPVESVERDGLAGFRTSDGDSRITTLGADDRLVVAVGDPALDALLTSGERLGDTDGYRQAVTALEGLPPLAYADAPGIAAIGLAGGNDPVTQGVLDAGVGGIAYGARTDDAGLSRQRLVVTLLPR